MTDRTTEFRQLAVQRAKLAGLDQVKLTKISSDAILPRVRAKSTFARSSCEVNKSLETLHSFISKNRAVFLHPERASDRERDSIESEVGLFVKAAKERIDQLQEQIEDLTSGKSSKKQNVSKHTAAHLQGIVLILSERLRASTEMFDQCRAARFQDHLRAWDHTQQLRKEVAKQNHFSGGAGQHSGGDSTGDYMSHGPSHGMHQQSVMQQDGAMLVKELEGLVDQVRETEGRVVEISTLNHLFSTQICQQAAQIEKLYHNAIEATMHMEKGNTELRKAAAYNSSGRKYFVLIILLAALILLFLDWISA